MGLRNVVVLLVYRLLSSFFLFGGGVEGEGRYSTWTNNLCEYL